MRGKQDLIQLTIEGTVEEYLRSRSQQEKDDYQYSLSDRSMFVCPGLNDYAREHGGIHKLSSSVAKKNNPARQSC